MRYLLIFIAILFFSCKSSTVELFDKTQTIELIHIPWTCDGSDFLTPIPKNFAKYHEWDCARWLTPDDLRKYPADSLNDSLKYYSIFIEAADSSLSLPDNIQSDSIEFFNDGIRLTGQFYKRKGFVKGHRPKDLSDSARVFRYSKFEILKDKYKDILKIN